MKKEVGRVEFLKKLKGKVTKKELGVIEDAYTLAKYGHRNQLRDQGGRYFEHPKKVALILMDELGIYDPEAIILALLHDVLEDTFILSEAGIQRLFGKRVLLGLLVLTNKGNKEKYLQGLAGCQDPEVVLVKFADRLHNLRTMGSGIRPEKRIKKVKETKEKYLPILENQVKRTNSSELKLLQSKILKELGILETIQ